MEALNWMLRLKYDTKIISAFSDIVFIESKQILSVSKLQAAGWPFCHRKNKCLNTDRAAEEVKNIVLLEERHVEKKVLYVMRSDM